MLLCSLDLETCFSLNLCDSLNCDYEVIGLFFFIILRCTLFFLYFHFPSIMHFYL